METSPYLYTRALTSAHYIPERQIHCQQNRTEKPGNDAAGGRPTIAQMVCDFCCPEGRMTWPGFPVSVRSTLLPASADLGVCAGSLPVY